MPIRIAIWSSDQLHRYALEALIETQSDLIVVAAEDTSSGTLGAVHEEAADVLVIDRGDAPPELVGTAAAVTRVVLLSDKEPSNAIGSLNLGARAVVTGSPKPEALFNAIRMAACGSHVVAPSQTTSQFEPVASATPGDGVYPAVELTAREEEVLRLLADGLSTPEMGKRLSISLATVRSHIHSLLAKLQVQSRSQAVAIAYQLGFLSPGAGRSHLPHSASPRPRPDGSRIR